MGRRRAIDRRVLAALVGTALVAASCGSGASSPVQVTESRWNANSEPLAPSLREHIDTSPGGWPEDVFTYGFIGLTNWSEQPITVLDVIPEVVAGEFDLVELRMLGQPLEFSLFDVRPGRASTVFPDSVALADFVIGPLDEWVAGGEQPVGDQLLVSFRNLSRTEDLYVHSWTITYRVGDEERELRLEAHSFISCLPSSPIETCGSEYVEIWPDRP